jgi:hypothetical protein
MKTPFLLILLSTCLAAYAVGANGQVQAPQQPPQANYWGDYNVCLKYARQRIAYVHPTMQEQALGLELNACMYHKGWQGFAPVDREEERMFQQLHDY